MQFNTVAVVLAAITALVSATETTTIYACPSSTSTSTSTSLRAGVATSTIASTGVVTAPTSTGSPIAHVTNGASLNGVSALGMIIAGGVVMLL